MLMASAAVGNRQSAIEIAGHSTTVFTEKLLRLDRQRKKIEPRVSRTRWAAVADVSERTLRRLLTGIVQPRPRTVRLLEVALRELAENRVLTPRERTLQAEYRLSVGLLAAEMGISAEAVLAADPRKDRGEVARCRMRAFYVLVVAKRGSMTACAKVIGITKQAISKSMHAVEDERDDPATDALLDRLARLIGGGA